MSKIRIRHIDLFSAVPDLRLSEYGFKTWARKNLKMSKEEKEIVKHIASLKTGGYISREVDGQILDIYVIAHSREKSFKFLLESRVICKQVGEINE